MAEEQNVRRRSQCNQRSIEVLRKVWNIGPKPTSEPVEHIPQTSRKREEQSLNDKPLHTAKVLEDSLNNHDGASKDTVLYLAYGSNLSAETFKGNRGIKPLSQLNVLVPELDLTFDLPGIPYIEPCFANTRYRVPKHSIVGSDYHKDRWHKGLVGVVYEVTKADYATIIATEGGGSSYQDIIVQCYELPIDSKLVDPNPSTAPFKAHTLFSPSIPSGTPPPKEGGRPSRPDPSYAQASARYLKLITDGAEEHNLPEEYRDYLAGLRPYTITSSSQKAGKAVFMAVWFPLIIFSFGLGRMFSDEKGILPAWLVKLTGLLFDSMWFSYDKGFKKLFGDGERTQKEDAESMLERPWRACIQEKQPLLRRHS